VTAIVMTSGVRSGLDKLDHPVTPSREVDQIDGSLVCTAVRHVTHDVMDFVLEAEQPSRFAFEPGQHLTITVTVDGERLSRCYSVSSPASQPDSLTITVKRTPGGLVSHWLHDHVRPGDLLEVAGPFGAFTSTQLRAAPQLYLSAGSGITPLMSMARTIVDEGESADVVLVHHARTPDDIVFRHELAGMGDQHPGVRVVVVCEGDCPTEAWTGHRGRIDAAFLAAEVPDVREREVFLCGPSAYLVAAQAALATCGVDASRVHVESYDLRTDSPAAAVDADLTADVATVVATYAVDFRASGRVVDCPAGTTILEAASQAGLSLASSCREGVCGTCKTSMLTGSVDMRHGGGIRQREIDRNQILLCCSTPTTDLVLDA
jgi:glycine betaine catabolism B